MANSKGKTEHTGAKNGGGGMWGKRADVKRESNSRRRAEDKRTERLVLDLLEFLRTP